MRGFFFYSSALVKRYARETGTALINHLFGNVNPTRFFLLNIALAEVVSVLVRKRNSGVLPSAVFTQAMIDFGSEIIQPLSPQKIPLDNRLVTAALPLIATHSINASDAIALQSALFLQASFRAAGNDLVFVASDQRLLRAAQGEGITTLNPETQNQAALDALLQP